MSRSALIVRPPDYENARHHAHGRNCVVPALVFRQILRLRIQRLVILPRQSLWRSEELELRGLMSEGERNLRAVLERPDASQQLQAALAHATPAGTLYILVGLRRCDRVAYQKVFDSVARPSDDVEVVRGCMISKEPFRQLLSQIQDGRFDDYLSRSPR